MASLNGTSGGGWLEYASLIEEAGADALELNVYDMPTDPRVTGEHIEQRTIDIVQSIKKDTDLPLSVKLSPFYTSMVHMASRLAQAGADGLVLFNRFYQPDIDIEELEVATSLTLSDSSELLLRLRWIAVMHGVVNADLSISGGVHDVEDLVKALMVGATTVQTVSGLLKRGIGYLGDLRQQLLQWMTDHEYESLEQLRGSMSLERCPNPKAFERANYMQILQSWESIAP